jgi:hypothetical protein
MDPFEKHKGKNVQQIVCIFKLETPSALTSNVSAAQGSPVQISKDHAAIPWIWDSPSHNQLA